LGKTLKEKLGHAILIYDVHELREKMLFDHPGKLLLPVNYIYSKITARNEIQDIRHFDGIIAISEILAEKYKLLRPHISATSIYNYSYFKSVTSHAGGLAKNYDVIYSGTVSKLRGIIEIVEAVRLLKEQLPKIKVLIIGSFTSNALKEKTNKQIIFYKLSENLILHDQVPFNEIADYYNQSKIGLCIFQPVNIFRNALFIKTFEYMAFGLPIVGSNFGNIARYIQYDEIGICVNPLNPVEISNAILKILHTPTLFDKYSSNGKKAVNEKYNWQAEEPKLIGFYEALLPEEK
jgi:glycosyltransferase involved in cell wall biosynthesis